MDCGAILEAVRKDTVYALRAMCKRPVFSATAVFILALGIGGTTAMFTVIRGVLLRPLEYRDPDRLVRLSAEYTKLNSNNTPFSLRRFLELKGAARSFNGVGAYLHTPENVTLSGAGEPEALMEARVSADFLAILGVQPLVGRSFLPQEDTRGGPSVAMISDNLWKRLFGRDLHVLGKTVDLNLTPHTIIGVLPAGFAFPFPGLTFG
jgi:MacB-like periplasmic core domain